MSEFVKWSLAIQNNFDRLIEENGVVFLTVEVDRETMWERYMDAFPSGTNEIFRERREFECNCCRSFIRQYGNLVSIDANNQVHSIWDVEDVPYPFDVVTKEMGDFIRSHKITNFFVTKELKLGTKQNHGESPEGKVETWDHFYLNLPKEMKYTGSASVEARMAELRDPINVFKRGLEELTLEATEIILDLIDQGSLYKGDEFRESVSKFRTFQLIYDKLDDSEKEVWCWKNGNTHVAKIGNTSIGTLITNLSKGMDLKTAVAKYEAIVAPANYKRTKSLYSKRDVEQAEKKITEIGLQDSLGRRFAKLTDISVNNVLFSNVEAQSMMKDSVFDTLKSEAKSSKQQNFDKVEEISVEEFFSKVVPHAESIEAYVENNHSKNLMSLIAPTDLKAPSMLKWDNNFSWAYTGDVTDSEMRERVKLAGGRVDGVFRFTHSWNKLEPNRSLMDLHVFLPTHGGHKSGSHDSYGNKERVGWNNRNHYSTGGVQDVDYVDPAPKGYVPIENITFPSVDKMPEGKYICKIHNWSFRNSGGKGEAELEVGGEIFHYVYPATKHKEWVTVAEVTLKNGVFTVDHKIPPSTASQNHWNVDTNQFTKVSVAMLSPNYWDEQTGKGNKHYFFFLEGCKTDDAPRGFFNEFLRNDLTPHRKVFEALGNKMRVEYDEHQMSGLGFSSTQRNELVVKVTGSFNRMLKIKF